MKKILILTTLFFVFQIANCQEEQPLQLKIKYNEASARIYAFENIEYKIDKSIFKDFLKDPNKKENLSKMNDNIMELENRFLCPFYMQDTIISYAVTYKNNLLYTYYYNILGTLIKFDIRDTTLDYPQKTYSYSRFGNLIGVSFEADKDEQFIYEANGKLSAHWIGNELFDKENKIPKFLKIKRGKLEK